MDGTNDERRQRGRTPAAVALLGALALLVAACSDDPTTSDEPEVRDPAPSEAGPAVQDFLDATERPVASELCLRFTQEFIARLAPDDGSCLTAMRTLTTLTGGGEASTLDAKAVDEVVTDGGVAVVTVTDRISDENPLAFRLRWVEDEWLLDEIGTGAEITRDCIVEAEAVRDAVGSYLDDNTVYPNDAAALVPSYLDEPPTAHEVGADGEVVGIGDCAG